MPNDLLNHTAILSWPRSVKRLVVVALDVAMSLAAMWLAFTLRLDTPHSPVGVEWLIYAMGPLLAVPIFIRFGLYRAIFRYTGLAALLATAQATALYGLVFLTALLLLQWSGVAQGVGLVPRSVGILQPLIFLLLVGGSRAMARFWLASLGQPGDSASGRFLVYGAGHAGVQTAAAMGTAGQYTLIGFVDDDADKAGRSINDLPVFTPADVAGVVARHKVTDILLAIPSASRERRNQIIKSLQTLPVHIRTLPGMADLTSGRVTVQDIRELDIEDLLGREPVAPSRDLLARDLTGRCVLVTGAGGSIGSELCRQILRESPARLLLLDHNEFGLYNIHQELEQVRSAGRSATDIVPLLASVTNPTRLASIFQNYRPNTVYHAAAYKHVPLVEQNASEGILNNVFGTLATARAAVDSGTERFILISTDKAVRPTNVMGASKRVAELVLQALATATAPVFLDGDAALAENQTCFAMVRFGNVLGSSGSVVPLFRRQIASGGPVTVTHADVTRYFMTIPEAAQLVLQAAAMARGAEVFILDMGQPVKILDLAHRMVALSGLTIRDESRPDGDIEIAVTGLRAGEKLYEELLIGNNPQKTEHPRIMQAREDALPWPLLVAELRELQRAATGDDLSSIRQILMRLVHGYRHAPAAETAL
jgi:FlaA1/EpsC-like NDP-sugar epimerase